MKRIIAILVGVSLVMTSNPVSTQSCDPVVEDNKTATSAEPDNMTKDAINDITNKLEQVLERQNICQEKGPGFSGSCFDPVSSQSVVSQMCDKIAYLESKINKLTSLVMSIPVATSNPGNKNPSPDLDKLKTDIASLKRSSAFFAQRISPIPTNVTRQHVKEYNATVNTGTGIGFDEYNGVYQAPYEGVYHFSLAYKMKPEVDLKAFLVVDHQVLADTNDEEVGQLDILTSLKTGQQVWTDVTANQVQEETEVTLTFSGFLID